jgi:predicted RecA/RadA family phage recombinase
MPYNRPGKILYATATKAVNHGAPVVELGLVGVAVKQQAPAFGIGPQTNPALVAIAIGEKFAIISKGIVEVPVTGATGTISSPTKGDAVYITAADNTLSKTASANVKFGRIVEVAGERGTRTGYCRIDLDQKASF